MRYKVQELMGENCMTQQSGQQLYDKIYPQLRAGQPVELDFAGVKRFLSVFFNFAIGQSLRNIEPATLDRLLTVYNLSPVDQQVYDRVLKNAKRYCSDPAYRQASDEMVREQSVCL